MKRYLHVCIFCFDLVVLTLLLLSLGPAEGKEVIKDVEVAKIMKEKRSASNDFDDSSIVRDGASDDVEEDERVEVSFWCALLGHVKYFLYEYFVDFVNFACCVQASRSIEPAQVLSLHFNVKMPEANMVNLSSSDTEEALELMSLSPARGCHSPILNLRSSFGSELFEDWPEANDMVVHCCDIPPLSRDGQS
jgi:hypothetical protein